MTKDTFRKTYKTLHAQSTELVLSIKNKAEELELLLDQVSSREMSVAKTNLETAIMWATKAVVLHDATLNEAEFVKEYKFALNVINDKETNDNRGEIMTEVEDALRDVIGKSQIFYTEALNKVQRSLSKYL